MNKDLQEYLERIDKAEKKQEETARELDKLSKNPCVWRVPYKENKSI